MEIGNLNQGSPSAAVHDCSLGLERTHKAAGAIMMTGGAGVFYVGPCAASEWVHVLTRGARPIPSLDTLESGVALKYTI